MENASVLRLWPTALILGCLLWPAAVLGQAGQPKPPLAPTDGKPTRFGPPPPKIAAATLTFRLRHDRRLDGSHIRVTASGHRVGLYGSVPNNHQRRIAQQIAQSMLGITTVADHLQVLSKPPPAQSLIAQVQAALQRNPATRGTPITVQAYQDVVTLTAAVPTLQVKRVAIRLAHATPRVSVVQDHLTVTPGAAGDPLAASVRAALLRDTANPVRSLHVLTKGSYIYLRGAVRSRKAKQRAGDAAASVPGVTGMSNTLTVLPPFLR